MGLIKMFSLRDPSFGFNNYNAQGDRPTKSQSQAIEFDGLTGSGWSYFQYRKLLRSCSVVNGETKNRLFSNYDLEEALFEKNFDESDTTLSDLSLIIR